jgi:hypothetical protein
MSSPCLKQSDCKPKKDQLSKATEMSWAPQSKSYSINYSLAGWSCMYLAQTTEPPLVQHAELVHISYIIITLKIRVDDDLT